MFSQLSWQTRAVCRARAPGDGPTYGVAPGTRLLRALSDEAGGLPNSYVRPIEGVVATVDMNRMTGVGVTDTGKRPVDTHAGAARVAGNTAFSGTSTFFCSAFAYWAMLYSPMSNAVRQTQLESGSAYGTKMSSRASR